MGYLPIFIDVTNRPCVVIGGGKVATRKVRSLLDSGARVTVISPDLERELGELKASGEIVHRGRRYQRGDLRGFDLVYATSGDEQANHMAAAEAAEHGIAINVADAPGLCSFIAPSVVRRGRLQIAISTGGASPALARRIREDLESRYGHGYEVLVETLAAARAFLRRSEPNERERARKLTSLACSGLAKFIEAEDLKAADRIVLNHLGVNMAELGVKGTGRQPKDTASAVED